MDKPVSIHKCQGLKRFRQCLESLHRFNSSLDDLPATCMALGRALGLLEGLYVAAVIDSDELLRLQELAYSAHQYARRAA